MKIGKQNKNGDIIKLRRATTTSQKFWIIARVVMFITCLVWLIWSQNNMITTKDYIYTSQRVPKTFVGYSITNVSDLHNSKLNITWAVKSSKPDIIIVSGGLTDDKGEYNSSVKTIKKLAGIAPTYYVLGDSDDIHKSDIIASIGDKAVYIEDSKAIINSPVVDEAAFINKYIGNRLVNKAEGGDQNTIDYIEYTKEKLRDDASAALTISGIAYGENEDILVDKIYDNIGKDKDIFQVSIANQVSLFDTISIADIDILFSGETHGAKDATGKYSKGVYANSGTTMFLSGGIGSLKADSARIFNYPEIITVKLSDGTIRNENPLEKLLSYIVSDVKTKFDDDEGFKAHEYTYKNGYEKD